MWSDWSAGQIHGYYRRGTRTTNVFKTDEPQTVNVNNLGLLARLNWNTAAVAFYPVLNGDDFAIHFFGFTS